ncbi:MAG: hypothetical protein JXA41_13440 [Deltaproteobacteria bacterium]|nr:hypothetical protein [Deltaproteobacteria bacterium]
MAIAKMNRLFIVGPAIHKEEAMHLLQQSGLVHPEPVVPLAGDSERKASAALLRLRRVTQLEEAISQYNGRKTQSAVDCPDESLTAFAEDTLADLQELKNRRQVLERLVEDLAPWGAFDPQALRLLEENRVFVRRWRIDRKKKAGLRIPDDVLVEIISEKPDLLFYTVSLKGVTDIPGAALLPLPEMSLSAVQKELEELEVEEENLADRLAGVALRSDVLKRQVAAALNEARYLEQMGTLYAEEYLFGLQGWIPVDETADFLSRIDESSIPLQVEIREPLADETPPVLLKNNWFIRRIEPLLKLYGNPKYHDLDPSYFFAPFMILFFGICLSDAGYGVIFYIISHLIGRKWGGKVEGLPLVIKLCKAFAVSTVIMGLITGSIFGYSFENRNWILLDVDVAAGNPMLYFYMSLGLGAIHLSISYILGMLQEVRYPYFKIQKIGMLFVLWGGVLAIARSIWFSAPEAALNMPFYYGSFGLLGVGLLLTLFFATNNPNWFARLGLGLWNVYGLTGLIGDVLSYARLFGLGIATSAIASVMNRLAQMVLDATGPVIGIPLAVAVIILGHTFNLALSILGSTIHSARLHFVEAFKSFFNGGGVEYKPFKIERG